MKRKESRWAGDILGFLDAVSKIPVLSLLRFEKKQLAYWREHVNVSGETLDDVERRMSEVDSLLETRSSSPVKNADISERSHWVRCGVITKSGIEKRKQKLLEKIKLKQNCLTGRHAVLSADRTGAHSDFDGAYLIDGSCERDESPIRCVVEDTRLQITVEDDTSETPTDTVRRPRARRRKSVVSKMNDAIRRRRGR